MDNATDTLEAEESTSGGLIVPEKGKLLFRPTDRKSVLGLDVLATRKRKSKGDGMFKVPQEKGVSIASSLDEIDETPTSGIKEAEDDVFNGSRKSSHRRYRDTTSSGTGSGITDEIQAKEKVSRGYITSNNTPMASSGRSRDRSPSYRDRSPSHGTPHHASSRSKHGEHYRSSNTGERSRYEYSREGRTPRESSHGRDGEHDRDYGKKRSKYDRPPARSDWDDGRWEWEDTPRRDDHISSSRRYQPSPSPMFVGASPDARLVSPWLGERTSNSSAPASPWDSIAPSPTPIRASGSVRSASSRYNGKSNRAGYSADKLYLSEGGEDSLGNKSEDQDPEFSESMREEMEYNADRAWYDQEEGSTMYGEDRSSLFLGDEASFQKKEAELTKKLVRRDGSQMTLAQSKKLSPGFHLKAWQISTGILPSISPFPPAPISSISSIWTDLDRSVPISSGFMCPEP